MAQGGVFYINMGPIHASLIIPKVESKAVVIKETNSLNVDTCAA